MCRRALTTTGISSSTPGQILRFHDPRRFGSLHWTESNPDAHPLLAKLGPEPLSKEFNADYLYRATRRRKVAIKQFIMNSRIVVGVGNIYASEALFRARISPRRAAGRISRAQAESLAKAVKDVLAEAIRIGGTTLRDYVNAEGAPGLFPAALVRLRTSQTTLPRVQGAGQAIHAGSALDVLVRDLPAMSLRGGL